MRNAFYLSSILLTLFGFVADLSAQTQEVEEMWRNQIDTGKINIKKPLYLEISKEKVLELFDKQPSFGMYHDNYFITGIPTNKGVSKYTADAKFQISIRQRLTKTVLPFNSFLMLTYTQKSFWDIYEQSAPFADNNYNPGLSLIKPVIDKNRLKGMITLSFEHESNGKDSLDNRSWNYFTMSGIYFFNLHFYGQAKLWYGWSGEENADLLDYRGYGLIALNYRSFSDKFGVSFVVNPCKKIVNTQLELTFKPNKKANQL